MKRVSPSTSAGNESSEAGSETFSETPRCDKAVRGRRSGPYRITTDIQRKEFIDLVEEKKLSIRKVRVIHLPRLGSWPMWD